MSGSIRSCPSCKTLVLQDTVQCPECNHVFDESQLQGVAVDVSQVKQDICSTCGENVRHGMVRCWNCGGFMQEEIATIFQKMQAKPVPILYSDRSDGEQIYKVEDPGDLVITGERSSGATDDFELDGDFVSDVPAAESARVTAVAVVTTAEPVTPAEPVESSETYGLSGSQTVVEDEATPDETDQSESTSESTSDSDSDSTDTSTNEANDSPSRADNEQSHSVATGGDVLLEIALEEERETGKRRRRSPKRRGKGRAILGFLVFCPNGHRIEVQDRHRGKAGRCPKCKATFIVPDESLKEQKVAEQTRISEEAATAEQTARNEAGDYSHWMTDVHVHTVDPQKLRLKPGSLEKDFQEVDLGFSSEGLLLATLASSRGLFGRGGKTEDVREQLLSSLRDGVAVDELPVAAKQLFDISALLQLGIDQPVIYEHESMFVGIPVFGDGRIAVRFPKTDQSALPQFASFDLSHFREFSKRLEELFGIEEFGILHEIPLSDTFTEQTCHYSEEKFRSLEQVQFYQTDSSFKLTLVGRKCQGCGLVVSEDSRKKEKIGGVAGRGIAKAKCPKCEKKFGDVSLFDLEEDQTSAESPDERMPESPDEAETAAETETP